MKTHLVCLLLGLWLTGKLHAQTRNVARSDSFHLQRASIQDTFLLRVIPEYIAKRTNASDEVYFPKKGVIVVIVPRSRSNRSVSYRFHTEYSDHYLLQLWKTTRPLFYSKVAGRYIVVCDEWTGALTPISMNSQYSAIHEFAESGWLDIVADPSEALFELHSAVYTWKAKEKSSD